MKILVRYATVTVLFLTNYIVCLADYERKFYSKNNSQIVFPESPENEIKEIPMDLIRRLNEISNVEEFLKTMVETDPDSINISERIGSDNIERSAVVTAKRAKCMPELTTVPLKQDNTAGVIYYPTCTRVNRCGGCCLHDLFSCQPVESEMIPMTVVVSEYKGGHQLRFKETKIVHVEQHKKCQCDCKIRPENCKRFQRYSSEKCRCECANSDKERKCYKEAPLKIWDPDECVCLCRKELDCGSGFEFDDFTCSCIPKRERKNTGFIYEVEK